MKHLTHLAALCACLTSFPVSAHVQEVMNEPDSVYLFSYATVNDAGRSGLKLSLEYRCNTLVQYRQRIWIREM